jgi:hypothetical protein
LWQPAASKPNVHAQSSAASRLRALFLNDECTTGSNMGGVWGIQAA